MPRRVINDVIVSRKEPSKKAETADIKSLKSKLEEIEKLEEEEKGPKITVKKLPPLSQAKQTKFPPLAPRTASGSGRFDFLKNSLVWWFLGLVAFSAVIYFTFPALFSGTNISVSPKKFELPVEVTVTGEKSTGTLPFEIISIKSVKSETVPATGVEKVTRRASGKIIIYNNYSDDSQKLLATTRFSSPDGKIYRIQNEVIVPGTTVKNGAIVPGSIEATVYADKSGAEYNIGLTDFTIPGFKGDPRFSKFYARSKTEMSGGYSGTLPVASDKDKETAETNLKNLLTSDLTREANSQIPSGYILYPGATNITFKESEPAGTSTTTLTLKKEGTLTGIILHKEKLSKKIIEKTSPPSDAKMGYEIYAIDSLKFSSASAITPSIKTLTYTLEGQVGVRYLVDIDELKQDLLGKPKRDFATVLAKHPLITEAHIVSSKPFWSSTFPDSKDKITVSVEDAK